MTRRHKVAFGIALATVIALVVWTLVGLIGLHRTKGDGGSTTVATTPSRSGTAASDVKCPTTWASTTSEPSGPVEEAYPDPSGGITVSLYVGTLDSVLGVLAPTGWRCAAEVDASGDATIGLSPSAGISLESGAWPGATTSSIEVRDFPGHCTSCQFRLLCPLLAKLAFPDYGACAASVPSGGAVQFIGTTPTPSDGKVTVTATFVAPANEDEGGNWPSSDFETIGAVHSTFSGAFQHPRTELLSCQLPASMRNVCDIAVDYFIAAS